MNEEKNYITVFGIGAGKDGQHSTRFNLKGEIHLENDLIYGHETLRFEYISDSTGKEHTALFFLKNISGFSTIN